MNGPGRNPNSNDEESAAERRRFLESDSLAEELGIEVEFAPDELAPPVDHDQLRSFVRSELSDDETEEVTHLLATYRTWYAAWREALIEDARG